MARDIGWCASRLHTWSSSTINGIVKEIHSNIRLFTDDTS